MEKCWRIHKWIGVSRVFVLRYERSDGSGNRSETVTRTVIVRDTRLPVITILGDGNMVMEAGDEYLDLGASWFDLVDGNGTLTGVGEVLGLVPGEYEVRYEFTDSSGNEAQPKTRIVRVLDRSAPHLELNGLAESIHPVGESYVDPGANWFDLVDGNGTVFAEGPADWNVLGERVLIYRKSDQSGNAAEPVSRKVLVADLESPRLELEGEEQVNWQVGQPYEDVGAVWTDNFEGTGRIILSDQVNWKQVGEYLLTYEKVDGSGNRSETKTRLVSVRDRTVPELFLQGPNPMMVELGEEPPDPGAIWTDGFEGNGTVFSTVRKFIDPQTDDPKVVEVFLMKYSFTDQFGNDAQPVERKVVVRDTTGPFMELIGPKEVEIPLGGVFEDPGANWFDLLNGQGVVFSDNEVNEKEPGVYELHYHKKDGMGNDSEPLTRHVIVFNSNPSDIFPTNMEVHENQSKGTMVGVFASEDPDGKLSGKHRFELIEPKDVPFEVLEDGRILTTRSLDFEEVQTYELLVRVTDMFGGSMESAVQVRVVDEFIPIVDTLEVTPVGKFRAKFKGEVLDTGGRSGLLTRGFLISEKPEPELEDEDVMRLDVKGNRLGEFSGQANQLRPGGTYYVRAFAGNAEGAAYGSGMILRLEKEENWPEWADARPVGNEGSRLWMSPWFGSFAQPEGNNGWILHQDLGWIFVVPIANQGVWFWSEAFDWCWTSADLFSYFFHNETNSWRYMHIGKRGERHLIYDYSQGTWFVFEPEFIE